MFSVRRPTHNTVVRRMIRQLAWLASGNRHDVHRARAIVVTCEGDLRTIGRKEGPLLMAAAGQAAKIAAVAVRNPDAARVAERDLRLAYGRIAQEQRFLRLRPCSSRGAKEKQQHETHSRKPPYFQSKVPICLLVVHGRSLLSRRETPTRSEEHTSELQSRRDLVCRLLLEKKKIIKALL